ncbi:MAG: prepilin-type N-terminal cleavage/methylation domain-containing protein [bacterium]
MKKKLFYLASRGFTLIELVMVIAIIILLAAIIIPRYAGQTANARIASTKSSLENLRSALELCNSQTGFYPATLAPLVANGYLRAIPPEMLSGTANNGVVAAAGGAGVRNDGATGTGWYYNTTDNIISVNRTLADCSICSEDPSTW